jgi:hypothetical protein
LNAWRKPCSTLAEPIRTLWNCGQPAVPVVEILIDFPGVDHGAGDTVKLPAVREVVQTELNPDAVMVQHVLEQSRIAADGYALEPVVVVPVVVGQADGDAADDSGGQLPGLAPPLLGGVALDEDLVQLRPDLREGPIFHVAGVVAGHP